MMKVSPGLPGGLPGVSNLPPGIPAQLFGGRDIFSIPETAPPLQGRQPGIISDDLLSVARAHLHAPAARQYAENAANVPASLSLPLSAAASPSAVTVCASTPSSASSSPVAAANVYLFDWDNLLVDEKGFTYELMHNVVATIAHRYAGDHPEWLREWQDFLQPRAPDVSLQRKGTSPVLALSKNLFRDHLLENGRFSDIRILRDFVLSTLPVLDVDAHRQLHHLLCSEMRRQYWQILHKVPRDPDVTVPYPDIAVQPCKNARVLLEKLQHYPGTRVVVFSRKAQNAVEGEVALLNWRPFFDAVSGAVTLSRKLAPMVTPLPPQLQRLTLEALASRQSNEVRLLLDMSVVFAHPDDMSILPESDLMAAERLRQLLLSQNVARPVRLCYLSDQLDDILSLSAIRLDHLILSGILVRLRMSRLESVRAFDFRFSHRITLLQLPELTETLPASFLPAPQRTV